MIFFLDYEKMHKKQKFSALAIVEYWSKEMWSNSYVTFVDILAQVSLTPWSIFLFLDMPTLKLRIIIIIILPTDPPEIILSTARTTKN